MEKRYKIKDVNKTFGKLEFLSFEETIKERSGTGRYARDVVKGNMYGLLSSVQDDVRVFIKGGVPKIEYDYLTPVELVNPVLVAEARQNNRNGAFLEWHIEADGMKIKR